MSNFEYKKSLGQNFLKDDNITEKIVRYSGVDKDTLVIEIGPGAGSLSKNIVPISGYTIMYEIDKRLNGVLTKVLAENNNYEIIFGDFLKQDIKKIRQNFEFSKLYVVANLPYYITTPIIVKLMNEVYPDRIVIMVQDEVANRLAASEGTKDYGMISVLLGAKYSIKKLFKVSKNCFEPVPKVDSAVILLDANDKLSDVDYDKFEKLVKAAFQFKRKNLKNNLSHYDLDKINIVLNKYNYSLVNRAEDIPVDVFIEITKVI